MEFSTTVLLILIATLSSSAQAAQHSPPAPKPLPPTPAPAPAPSSPYVNLTDLLSVAGPFHTFLNYLQSTKVIDTFQAQANKTHQGITLFVPKDSAFSALNKPPYPSLSNLTSAQLKQVMLFHALPHFYTFADFKNLSDASPVATFAGSGQFALNFTYVSGLVRMDSGWSKTKVSSSVHSTDPVAVYQVDKVLLPEAVFGTDIPPMPAPAPAPEASVAPAAADAPNADATAALGGKGPGRKAAASGADGRVAGFGVLSLCGVVMLLL
ncbi:Fasciclin-like arabinogalactan protein 7 [Linum perenne]